MSHVQLDFSSCVDKYADYLFHFAFMKVGIKEDAEDLVQDTFLAAYKGKESYNGSATEKTWLTAILKNKIIDYHRKPKITESLSSYLDQTEKSFENSFFDAKNYGRWSNGIGDNFYSKASDGYLLGMEFQKFLSICLSKMPSKLKGVFISKFLDDEPTERICEQHNISSNNYWVIIFRSKAILRTCLEKKGAL